MTLSMVAFWGLVIYGVVWLARASTRDDRGSGRAPSPEDVLAERFARGEINEQEYRDRLDVLRAHQGTRRN
ncbi:SHOCT domain-containing protein [Blastococcus sp. SYSU DS1024]